MKKIRYIYYFIYSWNLKTWGAKDGPQWNALYGLTMLILINVFSILAIIAGDKINYVEQKFTSLVIYIFLNIIGYILFIKNQRYKRIYKEFKNEGSKKRLKNGIYIWMYTIISIGLIIALGEIYGDD